MVILVLQFHFLKDMKSKTEYEYAFSAEDTGVNFSVPQPQAGLWYKFVEVMGYTALECSLLIIDYVNGILGTMYRNLMWCLCPPHPSCL